MRKIKRPFPVTVLSLMVLGVALLNLARLVQAILKWDFLSGLLPFSPLYLAITGFIWGVCGLGLVYILWRGYYRADRIAVVALFAYSIYYWIDRIWMARYAASQVNLGFCLAGNFVIIAASLWDLTRLNARMYFGAKHER